MAENAEAHHVWWLVLQDLIVIPPTNNKTATKAINKVFIATSACPHVNYRPHPMPRRNFGISLVNIAQPALASSPSDGRSAWDSLLVSGFLLVEFIKALLWAPSYIDAHPVVRDAQPNTYHVGSRRIREWNALYQFVQNSATLRKATQPKAGGPLGAILAAFAFLVLGSGA
jgi:hypothetical protein